MAPLVEVEHLKLHFPIKEGILVDREVGSVHAVDDVTFTLEEGETLGLVGESGCGKTTLSRALMRLIEPTDGLDPLPGRGHHARQRKQLEPLRREMQMVFQDPFASLNPRKRVGQIIGAPLRLHGVEQDEVEPRVRELLDRVGLHPEHVNRFPHEFSGGQRQRIGVARALALEPRLIVLDEPVSALDVSVQAQIINLLDDLQDDFGLTYLFVAHDLCVVRHVSDRIAVMYLGKLMEVSPAEELYTKPIHPYTGALLAAIPIPDPRENRARERIVVSGEPPNPIDPPSGCVFHPRCPRATDICREVEPPLTRYPSGHLAACHHPLNVTAEEIAAAERSADSARLAAGDEMPTAGVTAIRRVRRSPVAASAEHLLRTHRNVSCTGSCCNSRHAVSHCEGDSCIGLPAKLVQSSVQSDGNPSYAAAVEKIHRQRPQRAALARSRDRAPGGPSVWVGAARCAKHRPAAGRARARLFFVALDPVLSRHRSGLRGAPADRVRALPLAVGDHASCWSPTCCRRCSSGRCSAPRRTAGRAGVRRGGRRVRAVAFVGIALVDGFARHGGLRGRSPAWAPRCSRPPRWRRCPSLVDKERLPAATSLYGAIADVGFTVGPALAALVFVVGGPEEVTAGQRR